MATIDDLRRATNEPEGDSTYNDDALEAILLASGNVVPAAAAAVWREKAAKFSELVDMVEGDTRRDLSDLSEKAMLMADMFQRQADSGGTGGDRPTTIGRITRA